MSFRLRLAVIFCVPAILLCQNPKTGSIAGRVVDSSTGDAISGAIVRLSLLESQRKVVVPTTTSELDGSFRFESVPPGRYLVVARKAGFVEDTGPEDTASVAVKANESASGVLVPLMPLGTITGIVVDENNAPLAGVQVHALILDPTFVPARLQLSNVHSVTNQEGHYSLSKLPGGSYYVLALPDSYLARAQRDGYQPVPTFFPEASCPEDAIRVFVQPAQTIRADITLRVAPTHRIEGKIAETPSGIRNEHLRLDISPSGERQIAVLRRWIPIRAERTFLAEGIQSGQYEITLSVDREGRRAQVGREEVEVGSTDVTGVGMLTRQSTTLSAVVRRENNNHAAIGPVGLVLVPAEEGISYGQPVGADGLAKIDDIEPDRYLVHVFPSQPGLYVSSLELNYRDISNEYVDLSAYSLARVTAVLRSGTGVISGTVTAGAGVVILAPQSPFPDGSNVHYQIVRSHGTFEFHNVPPGDYVLYAAEESNLQLWFQPAFLDALKNLATPVHVDENENQQVPSLHGIERSILRARAMSVGFYFQ